jgi:hypothetical protein
MSKTYKKIQQTRRSEKKRSEDETRGPAIGPRDYEAKYRHKVYELVDDYYDEIDEDEMDGFDLYDE